MHEDVYDVCGGQPRLRSAASSITISYPSPAISHGVSWAFNVPNGTTFLCVDRTKTSERHIATHWLVADKFNSQGFRKEFFAVLPGFDMPSQYIGRAIAYAGSVRLLAEELDPSVYRTYHIFRAL